jgi:hypothetical protein
MTNIEFPPFAAARPKSGTAVTGTTVTGTAVGAPVERRKRRTKEEIAAAYSQAKREPRTTMIPLEALPTLAGLTTEEADQVANMCVAVETFSKPARKRILAALTKIYE